jgi:hypothetical protein
MYNKFVPGLKPHDFTIRYYSPSLKAGVNDDVDPQHMGFSPQY